MRDEAALQRACRRLADRQGYWQIKLWPLVTGLPDALVIGPQAFLVFVEFKLPGGKLTRRQHYVHRKLEGWGFLVEVVRCTASYREKIFGEGC
jgi:hypothetical protein